MSRYLCKSLKIYLRLSGHWPPGEKILYVIGMAHAPRRYGSIKVRAERSSVMSRALFKFHDLITVRETEGWPMLLAAVAALLWANSPWSDSYHAAIETAMSLDLHVVAFEDHLQGWIDDAFLPLFFFLIGLEIKHEVVRGELSGLKRAAMPVIIGFTGVMLPIAIYVLFNTGTPYARGWGVPVATDVAFSLAVLSLLGNRVPPELKILLVAFAAVDDIVGVLIIAFFYSEHIVIMALVVALAILIIMWVLANAQVANPVLYAFLGLALWGAMFKSGVHTTIAGVMAGLVVPAKPVLSRAEFRPAAERLVDQFQEVRKRLGRIVSKRDKSPEDVELEEELKNEQDGILGEVEELARSTESPVERLIRGLNPWLSYVVLPLFALVNAGITFGNFHPSQVFTSTAALGVFWGLLLGKPLGIVGGTWFAMRLGIARLPGEVRFTHVIGMGLVAGMGFTVSLFISSLAFTTEPVHDLSRLAVLAASLVSGIAGWCFLSLVSNKEAAESSPRKE